MAARKAAGKAAGKASGTAAIRDRLRQVAWEYAVDVEEGLEAVAREELEALGARIAPTRGGFLVDLDGARTQLLALRTVGAAYRRLAFQVPRPKALLGSESFRRLAAAVEEVVAHAGPFAGLRIAAAGAESSVFQRLAAALAEAVSLPVDQAAGDLMLRVTPAQGGGWEVLVRLTPRPLSTRPWRVCNLPGGVNATVAVAMNRLAGEVEGERYLNLMCGSGTLLIERLLSPPRAVELTGVDVSPEALGCAAKNEFAARVAAGGSLQPVTWREGDVTDLDLGRRYDVVTADAPWGDAVGAHAENEALHAALLACAARHTTPGARFALLTHEVKVVSRLLTRTSDWRTRHTRRVSHGGHRPVLALLKRV